MMTRRNREGRTAAAFLLALLLILCSLAACFAEGTEEPVLTVDNANEGLPRNLRLEIGDLWKDSWNPKAYRADPGFEPSVEGLSTLYMSGSMEYSEAQFHAMADRIREVMPAGTEVWIFDLRQESHGFVDCEVEQDGKTVAYKGISMYWAGKNNAANAGKNLEEVTKDEKARFDALVGKQVDVKGRVTSSTPRPSSASRPSSTPAPAGASPTPRPARDPSRYRTPTTTVRVTGWKTEKELVESEGFHYIRLAITDRTFPLEPEVDQFIDVIKKLDKNKIWTHFHCMAGIGRTGIYMMLYDMMKNPDVPYKDILARQTMLGANNPISSDPKSEADKEKNRLMPLLYQYVQENHATNYAVSWSQWLYWQDHPTPTPAPTKVPKTGDTFSPELPLGMIAAGLLGLLVLLGLRISIRNKNTQGRP